MILPARLKIRVRRGDSLTGLALLAWGEKDGGRLLALWNSLPLDGWLSAGSWIEIPLPGPFLVPARTGSAATAPTVAPATAPSTEELTTRLERRRRTGRPEGLLRLARAVLDSERTTPASKALAARHAMIPGRRWTVKPRMYSTVPSHPSGLRPEGAQDTLQHPL